MEKCKHHRAANFMLVLVLAAIVITACSTSSQTGPAATPAESNPAGEPATPQNPDPAAGGTQSIGGYQLGFELGSTGLKASNPSQVNLAAGKPQLIEFFAFW